VFALCATIACGAKDRSEGGPARVGSGPGQAALKQEGAGKSAEKTADKAARCDECRARWCSKFEGVDLVTGCFKAPDPKLVPNADPRFAADCTAVMKCAFKHNCAYDPARGPVHCYCGSRFVDECKDHGPAPDAPCVKEWQTATRGANHMEVLLRFDQIQYPSAWAFHLLECDRERCGASSPLGRCTP
jgi:hypothetical protein